MNKLLKPGTQIRELLLAGKTYRQIVKALGVSKATISYHASKLGLNRGSVATISDWSDVQVELDKGKSMTAVRQELKIGKHAMLQARIGGEIQFETRSVFDINKQTAAEYAAAMNGCRARSHHRRQLRRKLVREGVPYRCAICGNSEWLGRPLSLELDHVDGDSANNSVDNLRLLCLNCHSQTPTWRGRNTRLAKSRNSGVD